jgi:protein arginine kinase activator
MYDKICSTCGTHLSHFIKTGMLGCPDCYKFFEKEVLSALKNIQGRTFHVGKKPKIDSVEKELLRDYQHYLAEKEKAGLEGRFSDMAKINKYLNDITEELKRRGIL